MKIPLSDFHIWEYPLEQGARPPGDNGQERLVAIGFGLAKRLIGAKSLFRARTSGNIMLGDLFYHFICDYNKRQSEAPIQYLDEGGMPIIWWFHLQPKWYRLNRVLDPLLTVKENGIRDNTIIICEQMTMSK